MIIVPAKTGDLRFVCECGTSIPDGQTALMHSFEGHDVVQEAYRGGVWVYAGRWDGAKTVMEMVVQRIRNRGESVTSFARRLQHRMDTLEQITEKQERNEDGALYEPV